MSGFGLFPEEDGSAEYFSRSDAEHPLGSFFDQSFLLDNALWPTAEHYYQALKFESLDDQEKVRSAETPKQARKLGRNRFKKIRKDWAAVKKTVMTRAIYIRCKTHPEAMAALLETGDQRLVENSAYDYFWGCGRDRRGHNHYGKVLMNVRDKLRQEAKEAEQGE